MWYHKIYDDVWTYDGNKYIYDDGQFMHRATTSSSDEDNAEYAQYQSLYILAIYNVD